MKGKLNAIYQGTLELAGFEISCAVLDDEKNTRILVERSVANAFGVKGSGAHWKKKKEKGALLPEYISQRYLKPFINKEVHTNLSEPISYTALNGKEHEGIPATALPDICDIWIQAKQKGALDKLTHKIDVIAENAYLILKGFAHVGIIALIDEATGYQDIRVKKALEKILNDFLLKEQKPYIGMFPLEFYKQIYELNNWQWTPENARKKPGVIGKWTNDVIYERLAPGILVQLKKRNPTIKPGVRKYKHFQFLTDEVGDPALKAHFDGILALMRASSNWSNFKRLLERSYPKYGTQLALDIGN